MRRWFKSLWCSLCGHSYVPIQKFSDDTVRVGCSRCLRSWGMNDSQQTIIEWDYELQSLYRNILGEQLKAWPPKKLGPMNMWGNNG